MNCLITFIIGFLVGAILMTIFNLKEMKELTKENKCLYEENKDLRYDNEELHNAEYRAMQYSKTIKAIEDIYFGQGTIVDKYDTIGKVFKGEE